MKTTTLRTFAVLLTCCTLFLATSCKKDDDTAADKTEVLTGSWQLSAMTVDPAIDWFGTPVTNVYAQLPACTKDDLAIFKKNGTVNFDEGGSKCEQGDPQTVSGTWVFNTSQTVLTVTKQGETESWDVTDMKDDVFEVEYEIVEEGVTYTIYATFDKK